MNPNPPNKDAFLASLKELDQAILDDFYRTRQMITIVRFSASRMSVTVRNTVGDEWEVLSNRLSPLKEEVK